MAAHRKPATVTSLKGRYQKESREALEEAMAAVEAGEVHAVFIFASDDAEHGYRLFGSGSPNRAERIGKLITAAVELAMGAKGE